MSRIESFRLVCVIACIELVAAPVHKALASEGSSPFRASKEAYEGERLAHYLLGAWVVKNDVNYMETTYLENGTFQGKFEAMKGNFAPGTGLKFQYSGEWRVEGDVCLMTTTEYDSKPVNKPKTNQYKITDVKQKSHKATDKANGSVAIYLRKIMSEIETPKD